MEEGASDTSSHTKLREREVILLESVHNSILVATTSDSIFSVVLNKSGPEKPVLVVMALHTDPFLRDQPALRMNCTIGSEEEIVAEVLTYNRQSVSRVNLGHIDDVNELILPLLNNIGRQEIRACVGLVSSEGVSDDFAMLASLRKSDVPNVLIERINESVVLRSRLCQYYLDCSSASNYNSCEKCLNLYDELQTRLGLKKRTLPSDLVACKVEPSEMLPGAAGAEPEKKRRGRPKGSKNKFYFGKDFVSPDEALNETLKDSADIEIEGHEDSVRENTTTDESSGTVEDPKDEDYGKASDRRLSRRLAGRKRSGAIVELLKRRRGRPPNITDPVECSDCGQSFTVVRDYKQHLLEHTNSFVCSFEDCTKRFKTLKDQEIHMRKHRGEKPYLCSECDKAFSTRQDLKLHARKHTGGRPFKCGQCPKSFARAQQLKIHAVVHTGEREYLCGECGHAYGSLSTLIDHRKRKHLHLRDHKCTVCSKGFFTRQELEAHSRTHTGDKPFLCNLCGKSFSRTHHLKRHVEGVHRGGQGKATTALVMSDGSILKFDDDDTVYVTTMAAESEGDEEGLLGDSSRAVLVSELVTETAEGGDGEEVQLVQEDASVLDSAAVVQLAEGQGGYILIHTGDEEAKLMPLSQYSQVISKL